MVKDSVGRQPRFLAGHYGGTVPRPYYDPKVPSKPYPAAAFLDQIKARPAEREAIERAVDAMFAFERTLLQRLAYGSRHEHVDESESPAGVLDAELPLVSSWRRITLLCAVSRIAKERGWVSAYRTWRHQNRRAS